MAHARLERRLTWFDATMIVSGAIIGAGIFMNSGEAAGHLQSSSQLIALWIIGGVVVFCTGSVYAELGAMFPRSGGEYVYLEEAFGPLTGFLYGWTMVAVTQSGSIAAVAYTCASFLGRFVPLTPQAMVVVSIAIIWLFTGINLLGLRTSSLVQNGITVLKLLALAAIVAAGLFLRRGPVLELGTLLPGGLDAGVLSAAGLALVPILFAYGGLHNLNFIAGEVENPSRTIPLATMLGVGVVVVLYVFVNAVYASSLSLADMARSTKIASDAMGAIAGERGAAFVSLAIIISTLGITHVMIMSGSRVVHAVAAEQGVLHAAARLSRFHVPHVALIAQAAWTTVLVVTNSYGQLLQFVIFGDAIFFVAITLALFRLRRVRPEAPRPYRAWGYPVVQIVTAAIFVALTLNLFVNSFVNSATGAGIILLGIPIFLVSRRRSTALHQETR